MTAAAPRGALLGAPPPDAARRLPLLPVQALLREQRDLRAVERFARLHDGGGLPAGAHHYRALIPLERPEPGQQYAFEVDLDACTGCKACVTGCHSMNGLDPGESFRSVGLLHGGTTAEAELRTVTSSCHHCVEPACLLGCPVKAYEKDPVTGIVRHLDDQCIGCQYCTLMCPYDAPKYSPARGIVRKCDLCSARLAVGQAPACVEACPNEAIAVRVVDQERAVQVSEASAFLPGAPAPDHTIPTTHYKTAGAVAHNLLPADFYRTSPEHAHPPLVVMLTLTQLSIGAFVMAFGLERLSGVPSGSPGTQAGFALGLAGLALGASLFHLGRPQYAFRALLGLRTSWLSREALAFGVFAQLAGLYALARFTAELPALPGALTAARTLLGQIRPALGVATTGVGLLGVFTSVMVYAATRRPHWRGSLTGLRFFATTVVLGAGTTFTVGALSVGGLPAHGRLLLLTVMASTALKLAFEASLLLERGSRRHTVGKRMALLMTRELGGITATRFAAGLLGGLLLPLAVLRGAPATAPLATAVGALLLLGELCERTLFFAAAPASRMPGGLR